MLTKDDLVNYLASSEISRRNKILIIFAFADGDTLQLGDIKKIAFEAGLREIERWNVADILVKAKGLVTRVKDGWTLTVSGKAFVNTDLIDDPSSTKQISKGLRNLLPKIKNPLSRSFVEESIQCLEADAFRAAIVFSWISAISILYDDVIANHLNDFNNEAKRRDPKWKIAITSDDLARMKESDFLEILAYLSVLAKNVKEHLKNNCLNLRNSCGHPSSIKIGRLIVEGYIEFLTLNIFSVF